MSSSSELSKIPNDSSTSIPNQSFKREQIKTYSAGWGSFLVRLNSEVAFRIENIYFKERWFNRKSTINYINNHLRDFSLLSPLDRRTPVERVKQVYMSRIPVEYDNNNTSSCIDDTHSNQLAD